LTAFSLCPTDTEFYELEESSCLLPSSLVTDERVSSSSVDVDRQLYTSLLQLVSCVRAPQLDVHLGWDSGLKLAAVRRLEETGLRYDVMTNTFSAADEAVGRPVAAGKVAVCASGAPAAGDDVNGTKCRATVPTAAGFTLDDIQQVLSAANCPLPGIVSSSAVTCGLAANGDAAADERALKEITAYLQSEIGSSRMPQDTLSRGSDVCAYNARTSTVANHDGSGVVMRLVPPAVHESRTTTESRAEQPSTDAGGTILVTDSNLPYLQQFLPNLQTVMQSVQSLVRCVPPQSTSAGPADSQQRSMSLPSLATSRSHDATLLDTHRKRKHSGHSNQSKLDFAATTNLVNSYTSPLKDFTPAKSDESVQTKMEADSAVSAGEGGFACGLCSRTFSKRLGLSVHIQRTHGRRRSSESVEFAHDVSASGHQFVDKPSAEDVTMKNCLVKLAGPPRVDGCTVLTDGPSASAVCMCDGCGEIVSSLDTHTAVCVSQQSPATFVSHADTVTKTDKSEPAPPPPPPANTAVAEMLQLAEHFLRQHVPTGSVSEQPASMPPAIEHVQMLSSPPPYSEAELHGAGALPAPAESPRFASNGLGIESELPPHSPSQPPGKEIIYEGSRMREFVEYQCEACLLTFSSSALANTHTAHHHSAASLSAYRVYACLSCSLRYRDPRIMRHHVVYLCGGSRLQTDAHSKQQLFPCSFCSKTFMSAEYMQLHIRLRHTAQSAAAPVQCVLPTPPGATSVPSLEQLVSHFRHPPAATLGQLNQATATSVVSASNHESSANHKELPIVTNKVPSTSVTHDQVSDIDVCKAASHSQSVVDGRQCSAGSDSGKARSAKAKGILYKNVFMQCEGTYYCSVCHADLTGRESKRRHKQLPCGDPKTASYSRRYSYVCPYCSEKFPSQKLCRQHQIDECLPLIGVGSAELGAGERRCPLCPKTCFGVPALKGHVMQVHHLHKEEASRVLAEHEHVVSTCGALPVDNVQEFNGVLSPSISSPSSVLSAATSSTFVTQTTMSPAVQSVSENISHVDGLESDDDAAPEPEQPKELFPPQLYESVISDDSHQPSEDTARPKRNRKSRTNDFFVMMFRNYPILAKGVSMCRSCAVQLEPNATADSHATSCTGAAPVDVRRSTLFRCTHCTATFWRAKDCRTHQLESCLPAHGVKIERLTEPSVACPMCDVRSYNRSGLMSHMKFRHSLDTDGVRQVMDRCGIRKSVPPAAEQLVATMSPSHECEDGSLSMDDIAMHCTVPCDSVMAPVQSQAAQSSSCATDVIVDGMSADLPVVSNDGANDTWRTANMVLQRSSADVCTDLN